MVDGWDKVGLSDDDDDDGNGVDIVVLDAV